MMSLEEKAKRAGNRMKRYYLNLANGLCPACGGPRNTSSLTCSACREKNSVSQQLIPRSQHSAYQGTLIGKRKRQGACPYCGKVREDPAYKMCSSCREKSRLVYHRDPGKYVIKAILNGSYKPPPPVPLCPICQLHRRRCGCGKYMKGRHGVGGCNWSCVCSPRVDILIRKEEDACLSRQ